MQGLLLGVGIMRRIRKGGIVILKLRQTKYRLLRKSPTEVGYMVTWPVEIVRMFGMKEKETVISIDSAVLEDGRVTLTMSAPIRQEATEDDEPAPEPVSVPESAGVA